ncbi:MAG: tetratricopeptide repeat protein [Isosphaeraceae bacterium]|nr:tetratricopeptide repeat protein [Isosphaeraceae bacterium]
MSRPHRTWRLSLRRLLIVAAIGAAIGVLLLLRLTLSRSRDDTGLLAQANRLIEERKTDLALSYLNQHLAQHPDDLEALDRKAEVLTQTARTLEDVQAAAAECDRVLRRDSTLSPARLATRRRLVELRLRLAPFQPPEERPFQATRKYAEELVEASDQEFRSTQGAGDSQRLAEAAHRQAEAWRLLAQVDEVMAPPADDKALDRAIANYERARQAEPGDIAGAERLAALLRERKPALQRAALVFDDPKTGLIGARPREVAAGERLAAYLDECRQGRTAVQAEEVRKRLGPDHPRAPALLARYRHFAAVEATHPAEAAAAAETAGRALTAARALADVHDQLPEVVPLTAAEVFEIRMTVADAALRRHEARLARDQLDRLGRAHADDLRVRILRGRIELLENRYADAIETWRKGLVLSAGTDAALTGDLALVLLQLGRVDEADPLLAQFRRLSGGAEPSPAYRYLHALREMKLNRPARAIPELRAAQAKARPELAAQILMALGQCHEALRDEPQALADYAAAAKAAPTLAAPRLARIRLLLARHLDEAIAEANRALAEVPGDPSLLIERARLELLAQLRLPRDRRSWERLETSLAAADKVAPRAGSLALIKADYLIAAGHSDDALQLLEEAVARDKRSPELWVALARQLAAAGRPDDALMRLEQAATPQAAGPAAVIAIERAKIQTMQGHAREARDALVAELDRLPPSQRPQIWQFLGNLYAAQRDRAEARKAYTRWAELLPDDPQPRLFLMELALAEGDEAGLKAHLEALRGKGGSDLFYRIATAMMLLRDRPNEVAAEREARLEQAHEVIQQIRQDAPQQHFAYLLEGQYCERQGDLKGAIDAYKAALEHEGGAAALQRLVELYTRQKQDPELADLVHQYQRAAPNLPQYVAEVAVRLGDKERAVKLARLVVEADPDSLDLRVWQARLLNTLGQATDAEAVLRDLIAKHGDEPSPWLALLIFQLSRQKTKEAAETAARIEKVVKKIDRPAFFAAQCHRLAGNLKRAGELYAEALKQWPADPLVVRSAAEFYEQAGQLDQAEVCLRGLLDRAPEQRWAKRALALILSRRSRDPKTWAEAYTLLGPDTTTDAPEDRLARAILLTRGPRQPAQTKEATRLLEALVADLPADLATAATARSLLVEIYQNGGHPDKAAALAAIDAREGAPPRAIAAYAEALLRARDLAKAEEQINRLAAVAPEDLLTIALRARLLAAQGRPSEGAALLEQAFAARESTADALTIGRHIVALLFELDQLEVAARVAGRLAQRWPETAELLATVKAKQGDISGALSLYQKVVETADPRTLGATLNNVLAVATLGGGDAERLAQADAILGTALRRKPGAAELLTMRGYLRHLQGQYDDEIQLYQEALKGNPGDYRFLNNMAWTLSEGLKRPQEALEYIDQALERTSSRSPQFLDTKGVILTRLGDLPRAIALLEEAARGDASPTIQAHLAHAYYKAGQMDKFRAARDRALQLGLTREALDATDRAELESLLFASGKGSQ